MINCFDGKKLIEVMSSDKVKPVITISSPLDGDICGAGNVIIEGTASDNRELESIKVKIDDGDYTPVAMMGTAMDKPVDWLYYFDTSPETVTPGEHIITAQAVDIWGNIQTASVAINVDKSLPMVVLSGTPSFITDKTSINITMGGNGIVSYIYNIYDGDNDNNIWIGGESGIDISIPITASGLSMGRHTIKVFGKSLTGWQNGLYPTTYIWYINDEVYFKRGKSN